MKRPSAARQRAKLPRHRRRTRRPRGQGFGLTRAGLRTCCPSGAISTWRGHPEAPVAAILSMWPQFLSRAPAQSGQLAWCATLRPLSALMTMGISSRMRLRRSSSTKIFGGQYENQNFRLIGITTNLAKMRHQSTWCQRNREVRYHLPSLESDLLSDSGVVHGLFQLPMRHRSALYLASWLVMTPRDFAATCEFWKQPWGDI